MQFRVTARLVGALLLVGAPAAWAQQPAPDPVAAPRAEEERRDQMQARYQIFVMEGVLERAVQHGAQVLSRRVQAVMPDMLLLAGAARARGFPLEGYGVFFDVEVPALRRSVAWSFRMLEQNGPNLTTALEALRRHVQSLRDQTARQDLEQALTRVELQVGPLAVRDTERPGVRPSSAGSQPPEPLETVQEREQLLLDPGGAYTAEVKAALIDAMLDYSGSIGIGPNEWLTIAARDNEDRRLAPGDPYEARTIILRLRGTDLAAFRAEQLSRDEARRRVEVREF